MKTFLFSLSAVGSEVILLTVAITLWLGRRHPLVKQGVLYLTVAGYLLAAVFLWLGRGAYVPADGFLPWLYKDPYTLVLCTLFVFTGLIVSLFSIRYLEVRDKFCSEFFAFVMVAVVGMMWMVAAQNLLALWFGLELMCVSVYALTGLSVHPSRSQFVLRKTLLLGTISSIVFLFGITYLYGTTGSIGYSGVGQWASQQRQFVPFFAFGMIFFLVGLLFKVLALPFHLTNLDTNNSASTPVLALLTLGSVVALFGVLTRVVVVYLQPNSGRWLDPLLIGLSAFLMLWGHFAALAQRNSKRMLVYFSIAQAGYVLVALVTHSTWTIPAVLFALSSYTLVGLGAFVVISVFEGANGNNLDIENYAGLASRYPILSIGLTIFLVGMAGMPVSTGFIGKWLIFGSAIHTLRPAVLMLAILGVLTSLISLYYTMRIVYFVWMMPPHERSLSTHKSFPVEQRLGAVLAIAIVLFGIYPPLSLVQQGIAHLSLHRRESVPSRTLSTKPHPRPQKHLSAVPFLTPRKIWPKYRVVPQPIPAIQPTKSNIPTTQFYRKTPSSRKYLR